MSKTVLYPPPPKSFIRSEPLARPVARQQERRFGGVRNCRKGRSRRGRHIGGWSRDFYLGECNLVLILNIRQLCRRVCGMPVVSDRAAIM